MLTLEELLQLINKNFNSLDKTVLQKIFDNDLIDEDKLIEQIRDLFDTAPYTKSLIRDYLKSKRSNDRLLPAEESTPEKEEALKQLKNRLKSKEKKDDK